MPGADASSEGVQRDLLPIIEGSQVSTKYGNVSTDYILFICSGAFHQCKPSDMLAELQGRLPIRVELKGLTCAAITLSSTVLPCVISGNRNMSEATKSRMQCCHVTHGFELRGCRANDFFRILTEPEHNMIKQQQALIATEGVELIFTDAAIRQISQVAEEVNTLVDNIGARRLHTILERILEDISFSAPEQVHMQLCIFGGQKLVDQSIPDSIMSRACVDILVPVFDGVLISRQFPGVAFQL